MAQKWFCDKCGGELVYGNIQHYAVEQQASWTPRFYKKLELCDMCAQAFKSFVTDWVKNGR